MAYIDAENRFFAEKTCASSMTSDVIDLGSSGGFLSPLYIDIKLTEKRKQASQELIDTGACLINGAAS